MTSIRSLTNCRFLPRFVVGSAGVFHSQARDLLSFHHPADQRSCGEAFANVVATANTTCRSIR
jgi:hypothetical protein